MQFTPNPLIIASVKGLLYSINNTIAINTKCTNTEVENVFLNLSLSPQPNSYVKKRLTAEDKEL